MQRWVSLLKTPCNTVFTFVYAGQKQTKQWYLFEMECCSVISRQ